MSQFYVSLDGVGDDDLLMCGYVKVTENENFRVYRHYGEDIIVYNNDPFIYVDDINDANILGFGKKMIPAPPKDC